QPNFGRSITFNGPCLVDSTVALTLDGSSGTIGGGGSVRKTGAGTVTFAGNVGYTGATVVSGGTLLLNATKTGGAGMNVLAGGALAGFGNINEAVTNSGTLSPGDPVVSAMGTLFINGALTLNSNTNAFNIGQGFFNTGSKVDGLTSLTV